MFISPAFAQAAGGAAAPSIFESLVPFVLIFIVFYFLLIRPQQKKAAVHKNMLGSIRRGDKIVTNGGLFCEVVKVVGDEELLVKIADGVEVSVDRNMIAYVKVKTEPADKADRSGDGGNNDNDDGNGGDKGGKSGGGSLKDLLSGKK